jgi:hypothetical protein
MKLNQIIPQRFRGTVVQQFGGARLVRQRNGKHELLGGTGADHAAALEWASLFAHEIVFTHQPRHGDRPGRKSLCVPDFQLA